MYIDGYDSYDTIEADLIWARHVRILPKERTNQRLHMSPLNRWAGILVLCSGTMASDLVAVRFMSAVEKMLTKPSYDNQNTAQ